MKTFKNQAAQGDMLITRVESIPADVERSVHDGADYTVTHSETGHNHVMEQKNAEFYTAKNDPFVMYMVVKEDTQLRHLRAFDTHESINVTPGKYRINRQREHMAEGFRRAAD